MIDIMSKLEPIGKHYTNGEYEKALLELENLWEEIPPPKEFILNTQMVVGYGAKISLKAKQLENAWVWAQRGLSFSGIVNLRGESEFLAGQVAFERDDLVNAKKYLKIAHKMGGKRPFLEEDPKYFKFIKDLKS